MAVQRTCRSFTMTSAALYNTVCHSPPGHIHSSETQTLKTLRLEVFVQISVPGCPTSVPGVSQDVLRHANCCKYWRLSPHSPRISAILKYFAPHVCHRQKYRPFFSFPRSIFKDPIQTGKRPLFYIVSYVSRGCVYATPRRSPFAINGRGGGNTTVR